MEVRYVERVDPDPTRPSRVGRMIKVLQCRVWEIEYVNDFCSPLQGWSPWKDVPTVKED